MKLAILLLFAATTASASPLADGYPLAITKGKLEGKGGEVLRTAIDAAQFVVLGSATPLVAGAVCSELATHGFHHLAVDTKHPGCPGYDTWMLDPEAHATDDSYAANHARARAMKGTFLDDLSAAAKAEKTFPKVLLLLDAQRAYRGLNPRRSSEMGNLIGEAAEGHKVEAINVLVTDAAPAAFAGKGMRLYDLRGLRPDFASTDVELERLVFGFDFLLVTR
jgi:hypothetical protein